MFHFFVELVGKKVVDIFIEDFYSLTMKEFSLRLQYIEYFINSMNSVNIKNGANSSSIIL